MALPEIKIQADFTEKPLAGKIRASDGATVLDVSVLRGASMLLASDEWSSVACVYDGNNNMTSAVYRLNGVVVLTLVMTYDGNHNMLTLNKS